MNKIAIVLIIVLSINIETIAQWETQNSGVTENLIDVSFVDSINGCVIGENATILTTNDGGANWVKQTSPITDADFTKVEMITPDIGYIIGKDGLVLKTENGGNDWLKLETGYDHNFSDLSFTNTQKGWLASWKETQTERIGAIMHTDDGGTTWTEQLKIVSTQLFGSTIFLAIDFLNDSVGWALGGDYADNFSATFTYYTENGGNSWEQVGFWDAPMNQLKIAAKDTLWGALQSFAISINGGKTWGYGGHFPVLVLTASPINGRKGWLFGYDNNTNEKLMFYTIDGGISWNQEIELEAFVVAMDNCFEKHLWVVGDFGFIMKRHGIITSVENEDIRMSIIELKQNHPNPFNPSTKIKYSLAQSSDVKITIYNIMGRKVDVLVNGYKKKGNYTLLYQPKNISSGIYIYNLKAGKFSKSKKMIFIK